MRAFVIRLTPDYQNGAMPSKASQVRGRNTASRKVL